MALSPAGLLALIGEEFAAARAAPMAQRQVLLVMALLDALPAGLLPERRGTPAAFGAEDLIAYRAALAARCPALATIFAVCALDAAGPTLLTAPWPLTPAELAGLDQPDYMVSLYNGLTVPRVVVAWPDGGRRLAHEVLAEAVGYWGEER